MALLISITKVGTSVMKVETSGESKYYSRLGFSSRDSGDIYLRDTNGKIITPASNREADWLIGGVTPTDMEDIAIKLEAIGIIY